MTYATLAKSDDKGGTVELFLFETDDGLRRWCYTTDRKPVTAMGRTFNPEPISRSELRQNAGETGAERLTIKVPFDNPVAVLHVPYLPPRPIRITVYSYQRRDLSVEIIQGFTGFVTTFNQKGAEAELQCSQIIDTFQRTVPWAVYKQNSCNWATYEEGCGVDKEAFRTTATVTSSAANTISATALGTKPNGWFTAGYATNPLTGETRFITSHTGTQINVVHPFTALAPGDVLNVYAGDDRTEVTCRTKFNNKLNYFSFDHMPNYNVFSTGTGTAP